MGDRQIVVTAPYVTLKTRDTSGAWSVRGVYEGGRFAASDVDEESLRHHLDSGLVEYADELVSGSSEADTKSVGQQVKVDGQPAGNASREAWAAYAASKGAPEEETRPVDEGGLSRDELRTRYAS